MLQYMDNMKAICILCVKVGMLAHPDQSKTSLLTVHQTGKGTLTKQYDLIVIVSIIYYPADNLRKTFAGVLSVEKCPIYCYQSCDDGYFTLQLILVPTQTTWERDISHLRDEKLPSTLQLYAAGFILSIPNMLAANYSKLI
jgi:hypothetical protein